MYVDMFGNEYESEDDYLDSLKQDDHYHFSIPFEYIEKRHSDGEYDVAVAQMEVSVDWNEFEHGYAISYDCFDMSKIDPNEGNSGIEEFFKYQVEDIILNELDNMNIGATALVGGTGTY
mgnify:CR=1 FL=1